MATPREELPRDERHLIDYLSRQCVGHTAARPARRIAADLQSLWDRPWSWRKVMKVKASLVKVHGWQVAASKGGKGRPAGLYIPETEEEWKTYLGMTGRTLNSHAQLHREGKRSFLKEKSGQLLICG